MYAISFKDTKLLENLIDSKIAGVSSFMQTSLKTLKKHKDYIINSIKYNFNNGVIEGINNKIKALKKQHLVIVRFIILGSVYFW